MRLPGSCVGEGEQRREDVQDMSLSDAGMSVIRDRAALDSMCRRRHIRSLRLFGSALRDDFGPQSDVDLLVEFEPGYVPGFLRLHAIAEELSLLAQHRKVDLVTIGALNPRLRGRVLADAEGLFARGRSELLGAARSEEAGGVCGGDLDGLDGGPGR